MDGKHSQFVSNRPAAASGDDRAARLERALVLAAYIVLRHGPAYAPYVDRLEKDLADARHYDPVARARAVLDRYVDNANQLEKTAPPGAAGASRQLIGRLLMVPIACSQE